MSQDFPSEPIEAPIHAIRPEWVDGNGHMNMAQYFPLFSAGLGTALTRWGLGKLYREERGHTTFTIDTRLRYLREVHGGDEVRVTTQILDIDQKRIYSFLRMWNLTQAKLAATMEAITMHVSLETRRSCPFPPDRYEILQGFRDAHRQLPWPDGAGRGLGLEPAE